MYVCVYIYILTICICIYICICIGVARLALRELSPPPPAGGTSAPSGSRLIAGSLHDIYMCIHMHIYLYI